MEGWRAQYGASRSETQFFYQIQDTFFLSSLSLAYFVNLFVYLWMIDIISFRYYILWRCGSGNDELSINKINKSLDLDFVCVKKDEHDFTLNFVFWRNVPQTFSKEGTLNFLSRIVP